MVEVDDEKKQDGGLSSICRLILDPWLTGGDEMHIAYVYREAAIWCLLPRR